MLPRIFLPVLLRVFLLHFVCKGADREAGLLLAWCAVNGYAIACDLHLALGAGEEEAFALFAAIDEVDAEAEVEALRVVEESEHNVARVAAIFPVAQAACCHSARGAFCAGDEVRAAEEMNEEIAGDAAAVGLPLAPLEEVLWVEGNLGCAAQ